MSDILPISRHSNDSTLVQTVTSEARAIVNVTPSIPGPFPFITFGSLFEGIEDPSELPAFCEQRYSPGQLISQRGEVPDRIYVVVNGIAILEASDASAADYRARPLMPAEVIGLIEGLAGRPLRHHVIASTECTVRTMALNDLILHLADHPDDRARVIRLLADFVRHADRYLKGI